MRGRLSVFLCRQKWIVFRGSCVVDGGNKAEREREIEEKGKD